MYISKIYPHYTQQHSSLLPGTSLVNLYYLSEYRIIMKKEYLYEN